MFDIGVLIYKDHQLVNTNLLNYIKNKKVIICPNIKISQKPTIVYLGYLDSLIDTHGVDEIIIIDSSQDKFFHVVVQSYYPRITTVTDESKTFIESLKDCKSKKEDVHDLIQSWVFQQAVYNCREIGFWEQPSSNIWEHLLANKQAIQELMKFGSWPRKIMQKLYKSRHTNDLWNVDHYDVIGRCSGGGANLREMGANFWYFNLFHNKKLESALHQISITNTQN